MSGLDLDIGLAEYLAAACEDRGVEYDEGGCFDVAQEILCEAIDMVDRAVEAGECRRVHGPPEPMFVPHWPGAQTLKPVPGHERPHAFSPASSVCADRDPR